MSELTKLSEEHIKTVTAKIGAKASILASAVAQQHYKQGNAWQDTPTVGACVLIVDRSKEHKPKIVQLFDLKAYEVKFELELFEGMNYSALQPMFHTFTRPEGVEQAFKFFDKDDASNFAAKTQAMIPQKQVEAPKKKGLLARIFGKKDGEKQAISAPSNFIHKSHIGFDPSNGFDLKNLPDEWKQLFKGAGITKRDLTDPDMAALIYNTARADMETALGLVPDAPEAPPLDVEEIENATRKRSATTDVTPKKDPNVPDAPDAPPAPDAPEVKDGEAPKDSPAKPVVSPSRARAATNAPPSGNFLDELKNVKLKRVDLAADKEIMDLGKIAPQKKMSIMSNLKAVLAERRQMTAAVEEEKEDEAEEDDEWD